MSNAQFQFVGAVNDFLRQSDMTYAFDGQPSIKDAIESQGVPHTEVGRIEINGKAVNFAAALVNGDKVRVFAVDTAVTLSLLRAPPLLRFVVDVNLGKLARWLRLLGFDTEYRNDFPDPEIASLAAAEQRIVLTRDKRLLHRRVIDHGYWVRGVQPDGQVLEVMRRYGLLPAIRPFTRCADCNSHILAVAKANVVALLQPKTLKLYEQFYQCPACRKVYWKGAHFRDLNRRIECWRDQLN